MPNTNDIQLNYFFEKEEQSSSIRKSFIMIHTVWIGVGKNLNELTTTKYAYKNVVVVLEKKMIHSPFHIK